MQCNFKRDTTISPLEIVIRTFAKRIIKSIFHECQGIAIFLIVCLKRLILNYRRTVVTFFCTGDGRQLISLGRYRSPLLSTVLHHQPEKISRYDDFDNWNLRLAASMLVVTHAFQFNNYTLNSMWWITNTQYYVYSRAKCFGGSIHIAHVANFQNYVVCSML